MLHVEHPERMTDEVVHASHLTIDLAAIEPNPHQPRTEFDEVELEELAASIRSEGVLQPITVRRADAGYQIVMGERRARAARLAGLTQIPAVVRDIDDAGMQRLALIENIQREDLNLIDEARAYKALCEQPGATQADVADMVGKSRQRINHVMGLLRLPDGVQRRVAAGVISFGHAKALLAIPDKQAIQRLADRIVTEGLTVRNVEEIVALGDWDTKPKTPRTASSAPIEVPAVMDTLSRWLDTRVKVVSGKSRGKIIVEFSDLEDLHRLLETLAAPAPQTLIPDA